jgi:membrane associated rhomboid family serine protease
MFLPLSDAPNPQRTPWITYALIATNVAVYALYNVPLGAMGVSAGDPRLAEYLRAIREALPPDVSLASVIQEVTEYDLFVFEHGFRPAAAESIDLLTSMFLHGGFMHLFGNMLFLWIYGDNVEYRLGGFAYLLAYLATGVAATLFYTLLLPGSTLPLVGASGAISGVLGFYFLWFPRNVVRAFVFLFPFLMNVYEIPARIVLGIYLVIDNLLPMLVTFGQTGGGVAHGAHIGGFVAGLAAAWLIDRSAVSVTPAEYRTRAAEGLATRTIVGAIDRGDMEEAARAYFATPTPAIDADSALQLAGWLAEHGHRQAALVVYLRLIRDEARGPERAEAHLGAGLVQIEQGQYASAYQHLRAVFDEDAPPEIRARAAQALREISARQKYPMRRYARPTV